jgi:uncharacterized protein YjbI with pentapeptide repeats
MGHADLRNADFRALVFDQGNGMKRASPCNLDGGNFRYAHCAGSKFYKASLRGADLSYADLTGCDLSEVDLTGAKLEGTIFEGITATGLICDLDTAPDALKKAVGAL